MSKIRVRVTMHRDDLVRYVDVDENEFPDGDTSTNKEFRELLKEELEDEGGLYDLYQEKYFDGDLENEGLKFEKGSIYQIIVNTGSEKFILTNE